ncbi:MAG TPA: enoyl-CoA hydratase-related protein, partial [Xanthobacteraceae bacterium]|nr:enoyl-CoA hydratase-related protein [Xanthobacteraceae bacterium]
MKFDTLLVDIADGIATITFNRPHKKNAMNPPLHKDMTAALDQLRYEAGARVVLITGAGNAFCGGMDLKEFFSDLKDDPAEYDRIYRMATEWRGRTLRYYPKPTIAVVNGFCFGGAFSIVEGCDLAVSADEATFGLSEVNWGVIPGGIVSWNVAEMLSHRDALFYAMTGLPFDGKKASEIRLVNYS